MVDCLKRRYLPRCIGLLVAVGIFILIEMSNLSISHAADLKGHFAEKNDIIGFWKMVPFTEDARKRVNKIEPWPLPFQWFGIYEDGRFCSMMSSDDKEVTAEELNKVFAVLPNTVKYQFYDGFMLVTHSDIKGYGELWGVNVIEETTDINGAHWEKGDILMSLDDNKGGRPCYYRHLTRIK